MHVRNVADAHAQAVKFPRGTSERFLLCGGLDDFEKGIQALRAGGERGLSEIGARCDRSKHFASDQFMAEKILELAFTPFERTVDDAVETVKSLGFVESKAVRHLEHQVSDMLSMHDALVQTCSS